MLSTRPSASIPPMARPMQTTADKWAGWPKPATRSNQAEQSCHCALRLPMHTRSTLTNLQPVLRPDMRYTCGRKQ